MKLERARPVFRGIRRALAVALVALGLAGCAATPATSNDPSKLVGLWRVSGVVGESPDTWLLLGDDLVLWAQCGVFQGMWNARGESFLADVQGGIGERCLFGQLFDSNSWLTRASGYTETGEGMALVDANGDVVATLTIDGNPPASENYGDEYTEQPTTEVSFSDPVKLPSGFEPSKDIVGHWVNPEHSDDGTYIEFRGDSTWAGSDGCNVFGGRYAYGADGSLLTTVGPMTLMLCEGSATAELASHASLVDATKDGLAFYAADGSLEIEVVPG